VHHVIKAQVARHFHLTCQQAASATAASLSVESNDNACEVVQVSKQLEASEKSHNPSNLKEIHKFRQKDY